MELAIIAGLGALGWSFSAKGAAQPPLTHTPSLVPHANQFPFENQTEHAALLAADRRKAQDHVASVWDPEAGKYTQQPYGSSDKTAHVQNQRRMELFTGAEDSWNHKCETTGIFKPEEKKVAVNSGGTARSANPLYDPTELVDRNVFGSKMNNVLPFEQTRVGPGLGVDPSVPSSDGLHSQFRVLPTEALNAHRVNQLPTPLAASGAVQVTNGGRRYDTFVQSKPTLVQHTPNTGAATSASFNAQAWIPETVCKPTRAQGTSAEMRGPMALAYGTQTARSCETHVQRRALPEKPLLASRTTLLAPTEKCTDYVKNRNGTKRESSVHVVGGNGSRYGNYVDLGCDVSMPAKQLDFQDTMHAAGGHVTARGNAKDGCWSMKTTTREQSSGFVGGKAMVGAGDVRMNQPGVSGLRENDARASSGACYLKKPSMVDAHIPMSKGRETQGRQNTGALQGGVARGLCQVGTIKNRTKTNAFCNAPAAGVAPYALQRADTGRARSCKKIQSENPRVETLGLGV